MPIPIETIVVPLLAEDVTVERRRVETGRVRVRVRAASRPVLVDEVLQDERVEVTRVAAGRIVDAVPPVCERNGVTIIPVVEEMLVVERRLVLVEEVHVRRVQVTRQHRETVTLRHQEAVIERCSVRAEPSGAAHVDQARPFEQES